MRRSFNIGIVFVLVLSCWGGALSAAPCPHGCHGITASRPHAAHDEAQPAEHCHTGAPGEESSQQPDVSGHAAGDSGIRAGSLLPATEFSGAAGSAHGLCDHCVSRGEAPTSSPTERESTQVKKDGAADAPSGGQVGRASAGFVKEIIPYEDGPPPPVHRHVLLGVFRI